MIDLYLCRHGEASFDAPNDRLRPLTEAGTANTDRRACLLLPLLQENVSAIWCSDLLRAQQTADIFASKLKLKPEVQTFLRPDSDPLLVVKKLSDYQASGSILVVAHMPLLGDLASLLLEGNVFMPYGFQTSEVVHLRGELIAAGLMELVDTP